MAWTSLEEEALTHLHTHLLVASTTVKEEVLDFVRNALFYWRLGWDHDYWINNKGLVSVTVFGDAHLERNLKFALVQEMIGMGPNQYCVIDSDLPDFESRLMWVLQNLPSHKVCLYPPRTSLGGSFFVAPWNTIGRLICDRPSPTEDSGV